MIETGPLRRMYGTRSVLDLEGICLREDGRYGLIGANGAGKTTLMRLLLETLAPLHAAGAIGYLPQKPYAFSMSVVSSIALGIPPSLRLDRSRIRSLVDVQLEAFGLTALAHKRSDRLSGGEAQRVALARLFVVPRRILLLDEPGSHIDLQSLESVQRLLAEYIRSNSCLLLLATHHMGLARDLTDELLFLDEGRLLAHGSTEAILTDPPHPRLSLFLRYGADALE